MREVILHVFIILLCFAAVFIVPLIGLRMRKEFHSKRAKEEVDRLWPYIKERIENEL